MRADAGAFVFCRSLKDMESLAEGIREEMHNSVRAKALADRIAALEHVAELSKRLRSKCNRELMELQRMNKPTNPTE